MLFMERYIRLEIFVMIMTQKTYLVLVKGLHVGSNCAYIYTDENVEKEQQEIILQPKLPWLKRMPFDEWLCIHKKHIEQIAEYLITHIVAYDPNLAVSLTGSVMDFKRALGYYIYCHSENASRSYKFFK